MTLSLELAAERLQVLLPQGRPSLRGGADSPPPSRPGSGTSTPRAPRRVVAALGSEVDAVATVASIMIHQARFIRRNAVLLYHTQCQ